MKKAERTSAIDNYLGIIDYCNDLRQNDPNALAMSESRLRDLIRTEAAGKLGFPDADSFYAHIMWLYAVSLYEAAYLDENGQVLPLPDKDDLRELPPNELRQRILASGRNVLDEDEDEEEEDEEEEEEEAGSSMRDRAQNQRDQEFAQSEHERKIFLLMICYLGFDYLYEKNGTPATTPEMIYAKLTS